MKYYFATIAAVLLVLVTVLQFRGTRSEKPPLWLFPDMDYQERMEPQAYNEYFENRMNERPKPVNTVIRGQGFDRAGVFAEDYTTDRFSNTALYQGRTAEGEWYRGFPIEVTETLMQTGRDKFAIFCQPCHGMAGNGRGPVASYGVLAANLNLDMYRTMAEGEIFNTITHGKNTMFGYGEKLSPEERWAVVLYVRALQRAQNATEADIPSEKRGQLGL